MYQKVVMYENTIQCIPACQALRQHNIAANIHGGLNRHKCTWIWDKNPTYAARSKVVVVLYPRVLVRLHRSLAAARCIYDSGALRWEKLYKAQAKDLRHGHDRKNDDNGVHDRQFEAMNWPAEVL